MKWHGSLARRVSIILIVGVLLGQALAFALLFFDGVGRSAEFRARILSARVYDLAATLDGLDAEERQQLADRLGSPKLRLLDGAPPSGTSALSTVRQWDDRALLRRFNDYFSALDDAAARQYSLHLIAEFGPPLERGGIDRRGEDSQAMAQASAGSRDFREPGPPLADDALRALPRSVDVYFRLADGQWVRARSGLPPTRIFPAGGKYEPGGRLSPLPIPIIYSVTALTSVLLVASLFAAYRVIYPLRAMARAAEQLGRDIRRPPLSEDGPREVAQAARAFNNMQARLIRLIDGRTEALAAMSHDLRTPVTRMRLRAELLPDEERLRMIDDIAEIDALIAESLDYMRGIDDSEAEQRFSISALIQRCVAEFAELGLITRMGPVEPLELSGRPLQIKRAIDNLLSNAFNYGKDPEIWLSCDAGEVVIAIADSGPGVDEALLPQLTRPFFRVEGSRNRSTGGTGLGLAIVKSFAERHGGRLLLSNREGGGLLAELRLPEQAR